MFTLASTTADQNASYFTMIMRFKPLIYDFNALQQASTASNDLDQAACYIKKLKERIENLKQKKTATIKTEELNNENNGAKMIELNRLPLIEIKELGSVLEVVLISELEKPFIFHKVISVLEEEGAVVINASFSVVGDKIYHTIHTQVLVMFYDFFFSFFHQTRSAGVNVSL